MPNDLEKRIAELEKEVFRNKSISLQSITNFLSTSRGKFQHPHRDSLPTNCSIGETCEVAGVLYHCSAANTWSELITSVDYTFSTLTAGEAIDASSASQWVYLKASDGKVYKLDSDADESTFKFFGVVANGQNVSANDSVIVSTAGIVDGFSGLTAGNRLYPSATAGTAGTTPVANQAIELGFAVSATQVFIMPRSPHILGGADGSGLSTSDETNTITIGFRPRVIFYLALQSNAAGDAGWGWGFWVDGTHYSLQVIDAPTSAIPQVTTTYVSQTSYASGHTSIEISILNITATSFDIKYDRVNVDATNASADVYYLVIA